MLSILLSSHSQMLAFCPQTAVVQLQGPEEAAGGEEWLYLISLFARSKMFPRNQAADGKMPLRLGGCNLVTCPCPEKQVFVNFDSYHGEGDFLTRKKGDGNDCKEETNGVFHGCSTER